MTADGIQPNGVIRDGIKRGGETIQWRIDLAEEHAAGVLDVFLDL